MTAKCQAMQSMVLMLLFFLASGCASHSPLEYYNDDRSDERLKRDFVRCGGIEAMGRLTYLPTTLPQIDSCMRAKGYKVSLAPKIEWQKDGATEAQLRADSEACGIVYDIFDGKPFVWREKLVTADQCMRSRGYSPKSPEDLSPKAVQVQ
jgi:hypothetical protein